MDLSTLAVCLCVVVMLKIFIWRFEIFIWRRLLQSSAVRLPRSHWLSVSFLFFFFLLWAVILCNHLLFYPMFNWWQCFTQFLIATCVIKLEPCGITVSLSDCCNAGAASHNSLGPTGNSFHPVILGLWGSLSQKRCAQKAKSMGFVLIPFMQKGIFRKFYFLL